jgi:hypothetical protein
LYSENFDFSCADLRLFDSILGQRIGVALNDYHFESAFFMVKTCIRSIELCGSLLFPFKEETGLDVPQPDAERSTPGEHRLRHDHGRVASVPTMDLVGKIVASVRAESATDRPVILEFDSHVRYR